MALVCIGMLGMATFHGVLHADTRMSPVLVSAGVDGRPGNGPSDSPSVSVDGKCVAFQSTATNLVAEDTNDAIDVFVRDRSRGTTWRVSVASDGAQANGRSYEPAVSGDCRYVAFTSLATNLVVDDTNGVADVFVHDLSTHETTRVSHRPDGLQGQLPASSPDISGDGQIVVFDTAGDPLSSGARVFVHDRATNRATEIAQPSGRRLRQPAISADGRYAVFMSYTRTSMPGDYYDDGVWLHDRATGVSRRIATAPGADDPLMGRPAINADGSTVAFAVTSRIAHSSSPTWGVQVFDRDSAQSRPLTYQQMPGWPDRLNMSCAAAPCGATMRPSLDGAGRQVGVSQYANASSHVFDLWVADRWMPTGVRLGDTVNYGTQLISNTREISLSGNGRVAAYAADATLNLAGTGMTQVFATLLDQDADGMPGYWEQTFGLRAVGLTGDQDVDSDSDGIRNIDEYRAQSHPLGLFRAYLAEGATSDFFSTTLAIRGSGPVLLTFQRADGTLVRHLRTASSPGPLVIDVGRVAGMERAEFSTLVESAMPLVVDRTMTWDHTRYSGHAETSQGRSRLTWWFAEGATHSGFEVFYLLQNPGPMPADVEVTYLLPSPAAPVVKHYSVGPTSRYTIWVNQEDARLAATDVSATVRSTNGVPILAERALYASRGGRMFSAGHASAGVTDLSDTWYFAEGATGTMFDEFITIANPGDSPADLDVTYLLPSGDTVASVHHVAAASRYTIWVDHDDPRLGNTAASAVVRARHGVPVAAERVLWWPGPTSASWDEAHVVVGATTPWSRWAIAAGYVDASTNMFVLLGNPGPSTTTARVTLSSGPGNSATREYVLAPSSRVDAWMNADFSLPPGTHFAMTVESDADIVVEHASYWDAEGVPWAGGSAAMAVPEPRVFRDEGSFVTGTMPTHRTSFDMMPVGAVSFPFDLDGLAFDFEASAPVATVYSPLDGMIRTTNSLAAHMSQGVDHLVITLPAGTRAVGGLLGVSPSREGPLVTIIDVNGRGTTVPARLADGWVGFESPVDIVSLRIWTDSTATLSGYPMGTSIWIGDILTRRR